MSNRLRLSLALLAAGSALWAATGIAVATEPSSRAIHVREGGVLRINISNTDVTSLDTAIDFEAYGIQLILATCTRLLAYPDLPAKAGTKLIGDAAPLPAISKDGRAYTFNVKPGFRFSNGRPVTAASFARAFFRAAHKKTNSPAINFMHDIVGVDAFYAGKAKRISGITVNGTRLKVRLTRSAPDFLNRVAMSFFCAVPENLPISSQGIKLPPTAGPYKWVSRVPGRTIVMAENPFYRGPRPHHVDRIEVSVKTNPLQGILQIEKGERDYDIVGVPGATASRLGQKYGVNRVGGQFHVNTTNSVNYLAMNTKRAPFNRANVRKAVNFAIDRTAINRQAGAYAGKPTDQVLPPNIPGYTPAKIYPLERPDLTTARRLAGNLKADVSLYYSIDPVIEKQALVIQQNLKAIGLTVEPKGLPFDVLIDQLTDKPAYDMIMLGWLQDYPDPFDFLNVLLSGKSITPRFNNNIALFDNPAFNRRLEAASLLRGQKRYRTYGQIDIDIMRQAAPWAPINNTTQRELTSKRVGCYAAPGSSGFMAINAACLK